MDKVLFEFTGEILKIDDCVEFWNKGRGFRYRTVLLRRDKENIYAYVWAETLKYFEENYTEGDFVKGIFSVCSKENRKTPGLYFSEITLQSIQE